MEQQFQGKIRSADQDDFPAITQIYAHYVATSTATFEIVPPDLNEMLARWSEVRRLELPYLVAEAEGQVTGFAYASAYRSRAAYRFTLEDSIYIHPRHVGRGIGRNLLQRLIECCSDTRCRQLVAVIGDTANVASVRLHNRFGFHHVGVLKAVGFKFDRWIDTVLMQRSIDQNSDQDPLQ